MTGAGYIQAPGARVHFSFRVRREAERILESLGVPNPEQAVRTGGYRITSTLDYGLQDVAQEQVQYWVACLQGAACRALRSSDAPGRWA